MDTNIEGELGGEERGVVMEAAHWKQRYEDACDQIAQFLTERENHADTCYDCGSPLNEDSETISTVGLESVLKAAGYRHDTKTTVEHTWAPSVRWSINVDKTSTVKRLLPGEGWYDDGFDIRRDHGPLGG